MTQLTTEQAMEIAGELLRAGDAARAAAIYSRILSTQPDLAQAHFYLGDALRAQRLPQQAADCYRKVISLRPEILAAHNNLANILREAGDLDAAIAAYEAALKLHPGYAVAWNNLGSAWAEKGDAPKAIGCFRRALAANPQYAEAYFNLANALSEKGDLDLAVAGYRKAIALREDYAEAMTNLGIALKSQGKLEEAIDSHRKSLAINPNLPEAHNNLGAALKEAGRLDEAIAAHLQAIALNPNFVEAFSNLGNALMDVGLLDEAMAAHARALELDPANAVVHSNLIFTMLFAPDAPRHRQASQAMLAGASSEHRADRPLRNRQREMAIYDELLRWNRAHAAPLAKEIQPHANDRAPLAFTSSGVTAGENASGRQNSGTRRLRIAYISPDFKDHVLGRNVLPVFAKHDHSRFEVFLYHEETKPDWITAKIKNCADVWRNIAGYSDEKVAGLIREDRIDILINLNLHMSGNRLLVFARKPAPVQICWIGYPGSTGLATMDYRISDPQLDPPSPNDPVEIPHGLSPSPRPRGEGWGEGSLFSEQRADIRSNAPSRLPSPRVQGEGEKAGLPKSLEPSGENRNPPKNHPLAENRDALYIERTLRLPETFWCYDPLEADLPVNDPPSRATGHIAFGCLNNFFKTNPPTLRRWAAILRQVPGSRLILQAPQGAARTRVLNIFAEESIAPDRIDFVTKMPRLEYLATYHKIDIALDTYPYNGHTTSLDAFWMGVPVITLFGEPVVSRGTLSQLTNLGLTELAADDPNAFIAKAIELAADPDRLGKIRRTLRPAMEQSALMDAGRFTANLEKNFILAWEKWLGA